MDSFRPQLGQPHHHAYIVEDIEATVNRLVDQLGAGPFFLIEDVSAESVLSRGEPAELVHDSAFGFYDGGAIELMAIESAAPRRVDERFSGPHPRIHHVGYVVAPTEVARSRERLDQPGCPEYLRTQSGEIENTFHDGSASLGHHIEIHVDNPMLRGFFEMVGSGSENWDGSEPLRPVES